MGSSSYVALDLELVDANLPTARIIEIGAVRFDEERVLGEWSTLVRPGAPIPYAIRVLTGIDDPDLKAAPALPEVASQLAAFVGDDALVGQSVNLDVTQLARERVRLGNSLLDTFELATLLLPALPFYDLVSVAATLGIEAPTRHRALADAHLSRQVFLALLERIRALDLEVLAHVNRLTTAAGWPLRQLFADAERDRRSRVAYALGEGEAAGLAGEMGLSRLLRRPSQRPEPLRANQERRRIDVDGLVQAMRAGGAVASVLPAYEERAEQLEMLQAVCTAFDRGRHLVVEAGTGIGKSLAYLLPALAFASTNNRRVVVSTNTINLQDQLYVKDIPDLLEAMHYRAGAAVLKGRTNYLCLRRWLALLRAEAHTSEEISLLVKTLLWVGQTATGDRAELRLSPEEESAWGRICSHAETCSPAVCPYHRDGSCFIARARRAAEASHLVIVNHALLLSDLQTPSRVIPSYEHLVVDEAHHLEEQATAQLSRQISLRSFVGPIEALTSGPTSVGVGLAHLRAGGLVHERVAELAEQAQLAQRQGRQASAHLQVLFESVSELLATRAEPSEAAPALRLTRAVSSDSAWLAAEDHWTDAADALAALRESISPLLEELLAAAEGGSEAADDVLGDLLAAERQLDAAINAAISILGKPSPDVVCWATGDGAPSLHVAPIEVGPYLRDTLLDTNEAVVLTSATLSTEGSFDYVRGRLGAQGTDELLLGSPFDYARAVLLALPADLPEPTEAGYNRRAAETIADVAEAAGGRTLALFTSHSQLRATRELLRERIERALIVLMAQGIDGSRTRLLQRFRSTERALLLGTVSFWEGVDVVGEALSVLVIARLPFAVPTDPVFAARSESFEDPFHQYAVPQAILRFKQGFGRLIRSKTDRGVVVVLDRRIVTRAYGRAFLNSLPTCAVRTAPAAAIGTLAREWLARDHQEQ